MSVDPREPKNASTMARIPQELRERFEQSVLNIRNLYTKHRYEKYRDGDGLEEAYNVLRTVALLFAGNNEEAVNRALLDAWSHIRLTIFEPEEVLQKLCWSSQKHYRKLCEKGAGSLQADPLKL